MENVNENGGCSTSEINVSAGLKATEHPEGNLDMKVLSYQ